MTPIDRIRAARAHLPRARLTRPDERIVRAIPTHVRAHIRLADRADIARAALRHRAATEHEITIAQALIRAARPMHVRALAITKARGFYLFRAGVHTFRIAVCHGTQGRVTIISGIPSQFPHLFTRDPNGACRLTTQGVLTCARAARERANLATAA